MARYKYEGDQPVSLPEYGLEVVFPGDTVEIDRELDHPAFRLLTEAKAKKADVEPIATASEAKKG